MKSIEYKPEEAFPVIFHCFGPLPPSITVGGAQQLHWKLGEVLKKIPVEGYGDRRNEIISRARGLCEKFIAKVETGRAHSRETYAECKALLSVINEERK